MPWQVAIIPLKHPCFTEHLVSNLNLPEHSLRANLRSLQPYFILKVLGGDIQVFDSLNVAMDNTVKYLELGSNPYEIDPVFNQLLNVFDKKFNLFVHKLLIELGLPEFLGEVNIVLKLLI